MKQQPTYSDFPLISSSPHSTFTVKSKSEVCSTSGSNFLKMSLYNQAAPYTGSDIPNNELPRSFAAGYLKGGSTTYNPIDSTVLAPVQFARVSYTLFPVLAPLHILISPLRFRALLLWQHNIHLSKIPLPIISSSPVDILQILLWLLCFSLFVLSLLLYYKSAQKAIQITKFLCNFCTSCFPAHITPICCTSWQLPHTACSRYRTSSRSRRILP